MEALLTVRELRKTYRRGGGVFSTESDGARFTAVDGVSFSVARGETFAVVGESDCGKTTLAPMLMRLIEPDGGELHFEGRDLLALRGEKLRAERRQMQMIFQDPFASLNPRMRVGEIVAEPLAIHEPGLSARDRVVRAAVILARVGLSEDAMRRYPHEFSGSQRQRIGIARALILQPKPIVADEPISALDVSVGALVLSHAAGTPARIRAYLRFHLPQLARGGAGCHAHRRHARWPIPGSRRRRTGPPSAQKRLHPRIAFCRP